MRTVINEKKINQKLVTFKAPNVSRRPVVPGLITLPQIPAPRNLEFPGKLIGSKQKLLQSNLTREYG